MTTLSAPFTAGGPLEGLLRVLGVVRDDGRDVLRESLLFALVAWLPLALLALIARIWNLPHEAVLRDLSVHVRLLVGIPLFLAAQRALASRTREVIERLAADGLVDDRRALARIARTTEAWSRSPFLELCLLGLALLVGEAMGTGMLGASGLVVGRNLTTMRGPATLWYAWGAFPLFFFVALRFVTRWLLWTVACWRIARLPLNTQATHPDRAGGLAFVGLPTMAAGLFVISTTAITAASWIARVLEDQATLGELWTSAVLWASVALLLAVAPLVGFFGVLMRTYRRGLREFDQLAMSYTRMFHQRWIDRSPGPELLGTADLQALNDMQQACRVIRQMRPLPIEPRLLLGVIIASLFPFL